MANFFMALLVEIRTARTVEDASDQAASGSPPLPEIVAHDGEAGVDAQMFVFQVNNNIIRHPDEKDGGGDGQEELQIGIHA